MAKSRITDEHFKKAVSNSGSIRQLLSQLGLKEAGGNYKTAKARMNRLGLDPDVIFGDRKKRQGWARGKTFANRTRIDLKDILIDGSDYQSFRLKQRLVKEGILAEVCSTCTLTTWLNHKIPLELDHINGKNTDNRIENLRLLCPNCHALTSTYRGKNKKRPLRPTGRSHES